MSRRGMEFWERAATAALTGLCANGAGVDPQGAALQAAALADALLAEHGERESREGGE